MSAPALLAYQGALIAERGEQLSLTDMWKAAGSDLSRTPAEWLRSADACRFVDFLADVLNMGNSHDDIVRTVRGGRAPGTWAHWQVGLAYAKYLSPEFHVWCNDVVRAHMQRRLDGFIPAELDQDARRVIGGIVKGIVHKEVAELIPALVREAVASQSLLIRVGKTAGMIWDAAGLPKLKGAAVWLGNRLAEMGCQIEHGGRADIGGRAVRLFDPDRCQVCLRNGLLLTAQTYAAERRGQGRLRLVP